MGSKERMINKIFINLEEDFFKEIIARMIDTTGKRINPNMSGYVGELEGFSMPEVINKVRKDSAREIKL
jgi:hypothetical protein